MASVKGLPDMGLTALLRIKSFKSKNGAPVTLHNICAGTAQVKGGNAMRRLIVTLLATLSLVLLLAAKAM